MILPSLLEPCPVCGDDAEFCPKQRRYVPAPNWVGAPDLLFYLEQGARGVTKVTDRTVEGNPTTAGEKAGESMEKGGDDAR
jgi:hypothetical protein